MYRYTNVTRFAVLNIFLEKLDGNFDDVLPLTGPIVLFT